MLRHSLVAASSRNKRRSGASTPPSISALTVSSENPLPPRRLDVMAIERLAAAMRLARCAKLPPALRYVFWQIFHQLEPDHLAASPRLEVAATP
jgi:hypothetical protein